MLSILDNALAFTKVAPGGSGAARNGWSRHSYAKGSDAGCRLLLFGGSCHQLIHLKPG